MSGAIPDDGGKRSKGGGKPLNLGQVVKRTRNMLDPEMILKWNSYTASLTSLAERLMVEVATATGKGSSEPDLLELLELEPGSMDVEARPTLEKGPSTVDVKYVGKAKQPRIDLHKYLLLGRFTIAHGMRAHIPVERPDDGDPRLIFYFSKARFAEIGKGKKKKSSDSQGESASTGD